MNQFRKMKFFRMKSYLMVLIGEEYYANKDYQNAISFLKNALPIYRQDGWDILIDYVVKCLPEIAMEITPEVVQRTNKMASEVMPEISTKLVKEINETEVDETEVDEIDESNDLADETNLVDETDSKIENEIFLELKIPDKIKARSPTLFTYLIHNCTDYELPVELSIGSCDNFMFSGNKLVFFYFFILYYNS